MTLAQLQHFCLSLKDAEATYPFDEETLVFKVKGKMFALINITNFDFINLKCDPDKAIELRKHHIGVLPGWHMNKKHWNSVKINADVTDDLIKQWIIDSFNLVAPSEKKSIKRALKLKNK